MDCEHKHTGARTPPRNDEAAELGSGGGFDKDTNSSDSAAPAAASQTFASLKARAARRRLVLHELIGGGFVIAMSTWSREVADIAALARFLDQFEGRA